MGVCGLKNVEYCRKRFFFIKNNCYLIYSSNPNPICLIKSIALYFRFKAWNRIH